MKKGAIALTSSSIPLLKKGFNLSVHAVVKSLVQSNKIEIQPFHQNNQSLHNELIHLIFLSYETFYMLPSNKPAVEGNDFIFSSKKLKMVYDPSIPHLGVTCGQGIYWCWPIKKGFTNRLMD